MSERIDISQCPICAAPPSGKNTKVRDHSISGESFTLAHCKNCDLWYTQDPPAESAIGPYYQSEEYISHSDTNKGLVNRLYHFARDFMLGKKRRMIERIRPGNKLLDIGSGTGYFLQHMDEYGYEVAGIEVSEEARQFCQEQFGLKCEPPDALFNENSKQYNVITMWHVLEHLYDLRRYTQRIHELLDKDGLLVIAVPNHTSYDARHYREYWAAWDVPRHLYHFSPKSIQQLADQQGWRIETMRSLPLDAFYVALLSEKYRKNPLFPLSGFIHGITSWLGSLTAVQKSSSVVYFLRKK